MRKEKYKEKIITHMPTRENHLTKMLGLCVTFFKKFCQACVCLQVEILLPVLISMCRWEGWLQFLDRRHGKNTLITDVCLWEVSDSFLILKNLSDSLFNMGFFD